MGETRAVPKLVGRGAIAGWLLVLWQRRAALHETAAGSVNVNNSWVTLPSHWGL